MAAVMAIMVAVLGVLVLNTGCYHDISIFLFCFVMAGCQYGLLKVRYSVDDIILFVTHFSLSVVYLTLLFVV